MHHTVTLIAVNGITIARKKSGRSVFLCSLESTLLLNTQILFLISHWRDFLNSKDLSRQLYRKNGRKQTYLCLTLSGDCCCHEKGPKFLQVIERSPSKRREMGIQQIKYFVTAALSKVEEYQLSLNMGI